MLGQTFPFGHERFDTRLTAEWRTAEWRSARPGKRVWPPILALHYQKAMPPLDSPAPRV